MSRGMRNSHFRVVAERSERVLTSTIANARPTRTRITPTRTTAMSTRAKQASR